MATSTEGTKAKTTYPKISRRNWTLLRNRMKQSIPSTVSTTLITSVSPMTEDSARSNVQTPLRELGLIDSNNKPSDLMERWRHDDEYAEVCHEIRAKIYPADLIEAFPSPDAEQKNQIVRWFMKDAKVGEAAAKMYADTYTLLSQGDQTKLDEQPLKRTATKTQQDNRKVARTPGTEPKKKPADDTRSKSPASDATSDDSKKGRLPSIHIDVQVHISPDTTADQIDKIFESMSKHLSRFV